MKHCIFFFLLMSFSAFSQTSTEKQSNTSYQILDASVDENTIELAVFDAGEPVAGAGVSVLNAENHSEKVKITDVDGFVKLELDNSKELSGKTIRIVYVGYKICNISLVDLKGKKVSITLQPLEASSGKAQEQKNDDAIPIPNTMKKE